MELQDYLARATWAEMRWPPSRRRRRKMRADATASSGQCLARDTHHQARPRNAQNAPALRPVCCLTDERADEDARATKGVGARATAFLPSLYRGRPRPHGAAGDGFSQRNGSGRGRPQSGTGSSRTAPPGISDPPPPRLARKEKPRTLFTNPTNKAGLPGPAPPAQCVRDVREVRGFLSPYPPLTASTPDRGPRATKGVAARATAFLPSL